LGKIIFLNGTSSSGKTTLLRGLQDALEAPYLELGLDKFIWMLPKRYFDQPLWDEVLGQANQAGELGHQLVYAMQRAIQSAANAGLNVLADHVLVEPIWASDCAALFCDLDAYLIGVRCDLAILEQREQNRRDRTLGQARKQFDRVHAHGVYDFEVDTGQFTPQENVQQVLDYLRSNPTPYAFKFLDQSK
jgi:chloramphenicol 3-O phosphotransferase